jgi:hypothetical protein
MANEQNLKPLKKGDVLNPKGRGKGTLNRSTLLKKWLAVKAEITRPDTGKKEKMELFDAVTLALIDRALKGDVNAYKEIMDSLHGKIADKAELDNKLSGEIIITRKIHNG